MKYIRTKDTIYEVVDENKRCLIVRGKRKKNITYGKSKRNTILIGKANTIEELCDAFVMFCPNAHRRKIRVYETMRSISLYSKRDKRWNGNMVDKVYGAIWTDKGLIYVAKMNDKGELELL